jgi:hypothetical protein
MRGHMMRSACLLVFVLAVAAAAAAQDHRCVNPALEGAWAYTETGTVIVPTSATTTMSVIAAAVGRYDFSPAGTFTGTQNSSTNGTVYQDSKTGTWEINPDCTGTLTLKVFDPSGTTLRRTSVWAVVLDDNAREFRGIMTSMTLANGLVVGPVMTVTGTRLARDRGREHDGRR